MIAKAKWLRAAADEARLNWFEKFAKSGGRPALLFQDGRWIVVELTTLFLVVDDRWCGSVREAIDDVIGPTPESILADRSYGDRWFARHDAQWLQGFCNAYRLHLMLDPTRAAYILDSLNLIAKSTAPSPTGRKPGKPF